MRVISKAFITIKKYLIIIVIIIHLTNLTKYGYKIINIFKNKT